MPNSIEWTFPNTVLSDVHRIASGTGATVAVLSDLSNGKSRVCIPGRCHRRPLTGSAALKYGALPASVRVGQGYAIGAGPSPLARLHLGRRQPPFRTRLDRMEVGPGVYALRDFLNR